ncbi:MAG: uroporphyrinogen-III synthase [Balneolaceae bacterium]
MKRLLLTADPLESTPFCKSMDEAGVDVLHLPLDRFDYDPDQEMEREILPKLDQFRYVIHGGIRNAAHFLRWIESSRLMDQMSTKIHLTHHVLAAQVLEEAGIPAVCPEGASRPIDVIEFMLRISGSGSVLYPVADGETEEIPALLDEVGIDCAEMGVSRPRSLESEELAEYRRRLRETPPDAILFHTRGSVLRTWTAFPLLKTTGAIRIAASQGAAWKLAKEGTEPDHQAMGSWTSVTELITGLTRT